MTSNCRELITMKLVLNGQSSILGGGLYDSIKIKDDYGQGFQMKNAKRTNIGDKIKSSSKYQSKDSVTPHPYPPNAVLIGSQCS